MLLVGLLHAISRLVIGNEYPTTGDSLFIGKIKTKTYVLKQTDNEWLPITHAWQGVKYEICRKCQKTQQQWKLNKLNTIYEQYVNSTCSRILHILIGILQRSKN